MKDPNLKTYNSKNVLKWYGRLDSIIPIEEYIFKTNEFVIKPGTLLDIGIGGGRTTRYLINKCKAYIGIDYSEGFINKLKGFYPEADLRLMDAGNLEAFEANTFDFVNFSFNGIDYVNLQDREKILEEIYRVLKPGGIFFFSTHNMLHPSFNKNPWGNKSDSSATRIKTFIKLMPFYGRHLINRTKETREKHYSIINDSAHNYGLMTFYTSPEFIQQQLGEHHFCNINLYSKKSRVSDAETLDDWIFVTCKKLLV